MLTQARILLLSDSRPGGLQSAPAVARAVTVHPNTVRNVRRRFVAEGLEAALEERPRPGAHNLFLAVAPLMGYGHSF